MLGKSLINAAAGNAGTEPDPYFKNVTLLLNGDGTNGQNNSEVLDSSSNNITINQATTDKFAVQGPFSPFAAPSGYWSVKFANEWYLRNTSTSIALSTSDFTIEGFFKWDSNTLSANSDACIFSYGSDTAGLWIRIYAGKFYCYFRGTGGRFYSGSPDVPVGEWVHFAWVRSSGTHKMFVNGSAYGSTFVDSGSPSETGGIGIGKNQAGTVVPGLNGSISNLRIDRSAVYDISQSTITVPTEPLEVLSNTRLLTCRDNTFKDHSSLNINLTPYSTGVTALVYPTVHPASPFTVPSSYDASTNGGSLFIGNGNEYVYTGNEAALAPGTGSWTVQAWFFHGTNYLLRGGIQITNSAVPNNYSGYGLGVTPGTTSYGVWAKGTYNTGTIPVKFGEWQHVLASKDSSTNTTRLFVDGVLAKTVTADNTNYSDGVCNIGHVYSGTYNIRGYLSDVKIDNACLYTSDFTPPTAPLTADASTQLLCNFTNSGVVDTSRQSNIATHGPNVYIDTSTKLFNTGSIYFSGSGTGINAPYLKLWPDGLDQYWGISGTVPQPDGFIFHDAPFTIEMWVYPTTLNSWNTVLARDNNSGADLLMRIDSSGNLAVYLSNNGTSFFVANSSAISGASVSANQWSHIALTRDSNKVFRKFINGVGLDISTSTLKLYQSAKPIFIGQRANVSDPFTGNIVGLRVTKGICRYNADFDVPTSAFPDR